MAETPAAARRGVSLYSFQQLYYLRERSLEDLIAISADMGALGIESLAEQMMPGFPNLQPEFYERWHGWMAKYGTTPSAHCGFLDTMLYKGRTLDVDECAAFIRRDIEHAAKLGCSVARSMHQAPLESVEAVVPDLERLNVKLIFEVHNPRHLDDEANTRFLPLFQKYPQHVGFLLDLGIFVKRLPRVMMDRFRRDGAQERVVRFVEESYDRAIAESGGGLVYLQDLPQQIESMDPNPTDRRITAYASRFIWCDPERMRAYAPHVFHVHAKFWEMTDDGEEYSIPYADVLPVLLDAGYSGWISSEYEGQRHIQDALPVDEIEQVRRHQELLKSILGR